MKVRIEYSECQQGFLSYRPNWNFIFQQDVFAKLQKKLDFSKSSKVGKRDKTMP